MKELKSPGRVLTVVIRDDSPMMHSNDSPTYRSVQIQLTEEQRRQVALQHCGCIAGSDYYETISKCFIEPEPA